MIIYSWQLNLGLTYVLQDRVRVTSLIIKEWTKSKLNQHSPLPIPTQLFNQAIYFYL